MRQKDLMRHYRSNTPAYLFSVRAEPRTKHKKPYVDAVSQAAGVTISSPILEDDIEVEIIYSTRKRSTIRADIDNIIKPTLDALKDIAYLDDAQVRSVKATLFDRNKPARVSGHVEIFGPLFSSPNEDVLVISIYSDSRLGELGGEDSAKKRRFEQWSTEHP